MLTIYLVFLAIIYNTNCDDSYLPPYIQPCEYHSDNFVNCVKTQMKKSLSEFTKGIPELGVPSIDPVKLDDIKIDGNGLKLSFTGAEMHGLRGSELTDFKLNLGNGPETFSLTFKSNMSLTAKYEIDGRILILPIQGKGDAVILTQNVEVSLDCKLSHVNDALGEHLKLNSPNYKYNIEKTTFDLKNLFNGNKQLADTTLQFANENWQQLMDELAPPVIKQIVKTTIKTINKFFANVTIQRIIKGYSRKS
ncbi:circadian clock-controlled protein daywake [Manduca sexta]|uniref:circadian clock-controlled protein daywake n=1 Tax=Manduca sexta TaxID=7130 RepID=UPI0018904BE6|nr:circadian clock-controlled protein daywake [Manduca sexta]